MLFLQKYVVPKSVYDESWKVRLECFGLLFELLNALMRSETNSTLSFSFAINTLSARLYEVEPIQILSQEKYIPAIVTIFQHHHKNVEQILDFILSEMMITPQEEKKTLHLLHSIKSLFTEPHPWFQSWTDHITRVMDILSSFYAGSSSSITTLIDDCLSIIAKQKGIQLFDTFEKHVNSHLEAISEPLLKLYRQAFQSVEPVNSGTDVNISDENTFLSWIAERIEELVNNTIHNYEQKIDRDHEIIEYLEIIRIYLANFKLKNENQQSPFIFDSLMRVFVICSFFQTDSNRVKYQYNKRLQSVSQEILQKSFQIKESNDSYLDQNASHIMNFLGKSMSPLRAPDTHTDKFVSSSSILGWYKRPMLKYGFFLFVRSIQNKSISTVFPQCIPIILSLLDDVDQENKEMAIDCLNHCFIHLTPTEISWFGDLLFKELFNTVQMRDECGIKKGLPCLVQLITILQSSLQDTKSQKLSQTTEFVVDELTKGTKYHVNMIGAWNTLAILLKLRAVAYLTDILPILLEPINSDTISEELVLLSLEGLLTLLSYCWPRMHVYAETIRTSAAHLEQKLGQDPNQKIAANLSLLMKVCTTIQVNR